MFDSQAMAGSSASAAAPQATGEFMLQALVDAIDCGVIACDARGTVYFANRAALQRPGASGAGLAVTRVLGCDAHDAQVLDAAISTAATKGRRQLLVLGATLGRLMVSVLPLAVPGEARVLLLLGRRGSCSALALEMLAAAHGLTLAERRVLSGLLADATPREVAAGLGVALSTVRTQIASIRAKVGARSIEALLVRAAEVPPMAAVVRQFNPGPWQGPLRQAGASHALAA